MDLFEGFEKIKYYMMVIGALFVWFLWGSITGTKIIGDDDEVREERSGQQHFGSFNHK